MPLHEPTFAGNEKEYLNECIDSTFVSYVGRFVSLFEEKVAEYAGSKYAVATVNGTAALHIALKLAGVQADEEVICQPLTFVATVNAVAYLNAHPVFVDVERSTMGMCPVKLEAFLAEHSEVRNDGHCYNKVSGRRIAAVMPMHTFGHPCKIDAIQAVAEKYNITLVEDSAESVGSIYRGQHTGTFGKLAAYSFNGNKTVTCGGGGIILTDDEALAKRAKHITTTAKVPHKWEYVHDEVGYNYRLTNVSAALACAQMETIEAFIANKRALAEMYREHFANTNIHFFTEPEHSRSNYWLNVVILADREEREAFLESTNSAGVMTRPIWRLMNKLPMFENCMTGDLTESQWLEDRVVNIPSSVRKFAL